MVNGSLFVAWRVGDAARLNEALDAIEALPVVVPPARCDPNFRDGRCIVNVPCRKTHVQTALKQPYVPLNNKDASDAAAVPTYDVAAEKLLARLKTDHAICIANAKVEAEPMEVEQGLPSDACRQTAEPVQVNAFAAMMELRVFEQRVEAGDGSCVMKTFSFAPRGWGMYEGTRFYDGEAALKVKRWFHRVDDDASGCTFVEHDPQKDKAPGAPPAAMLINSIKLRGVFGVDKFKEIRPPALQLGRGVRRGAGVKQLEGVGEIRFVLDSEKDSEMRDVAVRAGSVLQ